MVKPGDPDDSELLARLLATEGGVMPPKTFGKRPSPAQAEVLGPWVQAAAPELVDLASEPRAVPDDYGVEPGKPSYAAHCLLARRLAERGLRFIPLCHRDRDHHAGQKPGVIKQTAATDRPSAARVRDLERRGLLDDTLVAWGGEFGRTAFSQGKLDPEGFGRDHPRCSSAWLAGGGFKPGLVYGSTDDFGYNLAGDGVHVHDLHATILHVLGFDHTRLTYRHQGRDFRLTDVAGRVVDPLLG